MSRGPEANFWTAIRKKLPKNSYAWRLENRVSVGMPDLYIVWESISFWIELKVIKSNKVNLSPQQIAWHTSHSHAGGLSFILAKHQGTGSLYLFESREARTLASEGVFHTEGSRLEDIESVFQAIRDQAEQVLRPYALSYQGFAQ